jgi:two-component system sensor histidine kinase/response regulator
VDDREAVRELGKWLMTKWGLEVETAENETQARELLRSKLMANEEYAVALIDQNLGGTDGYEVVKELRRCDPERATSIIVMSSTPAFREDIRNSYYNVFRRLTKPLRREMLKESLRAALMRSLRAPAENKPRKAGMARAKGRILVVEDNVVNQKLTMRLLEKMGHQAVLARNGLEALEAAKCGGFDLVLMDLQMPVMGGLEATNKIRKSESGTGQHLPIVAMTAHAAAQDERNCLAAGMDGYLTKPVRREQLAEEIERVMLRIQPPKKELETAQSQWKTATAWNIQEVLERVDGDRDFLRELLAIFREDSRECMERARNTVANGELQQLSREAHTMKGMLNNLAMSLGAGIAAELELAAKNGRKGECEQLIARLENALAAIQPEIEVLMSEVKA